MWFLHHKVILTKDNLVKRRWHGCKSCSFCYKDETIQQLFFDCSFAKKVWRIIHMMFGISPPTSVSNLFGNWLAGISKKELMQVRVGVCAVLRLCGMSEMILSLTNQKNIIFAGYSHGYALDVYVVISPISGGAACHGFWVQLFEDGSTGYIQPVRLAA
jgi:hypothetical protein